MNLNKRISSSRHCAITSHCLVPGETKHFKYIFLYLTIINACNIPQFLECKMQILFITVCDTSGTWIRKQLFYFISVITFQQISFTFQFGRENLDFLSISSPLTVSQQRALLVRSPSTAISYTKLHILTFITSEHVKLLVFTPICSQRLSERRDACRLSLPLFSTTFKRRHCLDARCRFLPPPVTVISTCFIYSRAFVMSLSAFRSWRERALCLLLEQGRAYQTHRDGSFASCTNDCALIKLEKLELHWNPQKFSN